MSRFLLEAASKGDTGKVREYLDKGADIRWHQKERGRTALTAAAMNGHLEVVQLLVDRGADINWTDFVMGFTPLAWACQQNHQALVEYFLKAGADPNHTTHEFFLTPVMVASQNGNLGVVKLLLEAGANVNAVARDGRTPLTLAQKWKRADVVKMLEEAGATPGAPLPKPTRIAWPAVDETGSTCDYSVPEKVLRGFILAMNRFEKEANMLYQNCPTGTNNNNEILESMQAVFDVFCTPIKRPYGRHGSFGIPPEYDPDGEFLIEVSLVGPRRAELMTRDEQAGFEFLYIVLKKKGRWLLDSKKRRMIGGSWSQSIL